MNAVFYFGIAVLAVLLWFLLAFAYKSVGGFFLRLYEDSKNEMKKEENKED